MSAASSTCLRTVVPTHRPLLRRLGETLLQGWAAWRRASRERAELRALQGLSARTLHDIGLADQVRQQPSVGLVDYERGRW